MGSRRSGPQSRWHLSDREDLEDRVGPEVVAIFNERGATETTDRHGRFAIDVSGYVDDAGTYHPPVRYVLMDNGVAIIEFP